ncbi:hypothetical protein SAMN03097699_1799 [Flavobacteriaceae bacterium MAR_2010_188]|nr:hypothetical protein SAMN03097699_1799 [Flavobacteriaceae bacterium MAR_2010_188]
MLNHANNHTSNVRLYFEQICNTLTYRLEYMRYHLSCIECHSRFTVQVPPNNEGIYKVECPNGHQFNVDILSHHFQVLFENAIHSLADDYYIESFVSFVTSYERFIEYFLRIVLRSNKIDSTEFENTWKELARQSERQVGAFFMIYLREFKQKPIQLSKSNIELRNKVIHKGYLPTKEDCIKFGDNVLEFIREIIKKLKSDKTYETELIRSVNDTGFKNMGANIHFLVYDIFPINRQYNQTDKKSISDFLDDEKKLKNKA